MKLKGTVQLLHRKLSAMQRPTKTNELRLAVQIVLLRELISGHRNVMCI